MQIIKYPEQKDWPNILKRPYVDNAIILSSVKNIISEVQQGGDAVLKQLTQQYDGITLQSLQVAKEEVTEAINTTAPELKAAIQQAKTNIEAFHKTQLFASKKVQTMPGVTCWQKQVGIEKVGLYIPGGTAPLFSTVLMLGVPAQLSGCKEVIICTPCGKDGKVNSAILYAAQLVGITKIFKVGGAQAIAAMAFGTETIAAVYKIFGPGNQYVTAAKQVVQMQGIAIDMPAGPSEVCVLADETAEPSFVASDLLSQAEHGADSQVLLVSTSEKIITDCLLQIEKQLAQLPRKEVAQKALNNSKAIIVKDRDTAIDMINEYAAEHLILACDGAEEVAEKISNAGSIFIGNYAPESVGDYASGTNHTLPTNAFARAYSGVSIDSFSKKITLQKLTKEGLQNIAPTVITMAEAEGLHAHANAVKVRLHQ